MTDPDRGPGRTRYPTGLVVGRFDPPHRGHSFMIGWAAERCDRLVVYVNSSPERDAVPGGLRAEWLDALHPDVSVRPVWHRLRTDFADEDLWQRWLALFREAWPHDEGPHAVFSSDPYVTELATRLDATPVVVDADRTTVPVSATMIRERPGEHLDLLAPVVREWVEANWL